MNAEMPSIEAPMNVYAFSPFDNAVVDQGTQKTAITMLAVFALILLTGLIGHFCIVAFMTCSKSRTSSSSFSAYVIIGNLTAAHLLYMFTCLPAIAYMSVMDLVTPEWLFGDVTCRLVPFMKVFILGVTTLSLCALAIDRFRSAGHVDKGYEVARDSCSRGVCKMLVLWLGALLLASPEVLMREVVTKQALVTESIAGNEEVNFLSENAGSLPPIRVLSKEEYIAYRGISLNENLDLLSRSKRLSDLMASNGPTDSDKSYSSWPVEVESWTNLHASNGSVRLYVEYETCVENVKSWNGSVPPVFYTFIHSYSVFRHWWILAFYFCLPVFFALVFGLLVSRRLSTAVRDISNNSTSCAGSYFVTSGIDGGTINSHREMDRATVADIPAYRTDSLLSNRTHGSDVLYRGGLSLDRQLSQSSYSQYQSRLSPLLSHDDLTDASPTAVVVSNGSLRTIGSSRRVGEISPQSPVSPSLACASGVSVLSLATSNAQGGGGTLGTASLPPHGHRRSIKRRSSRALKQTLGNASRERALNSVLVSFVLAFTLTQLPMRIVSILRVETGLFALLEAHYVALIEELCLYFSMLTYAINPIVLCLCYKLYRTFLADSCCCC